MNVGVVDCIACIVDADVNLLLVTKVKMFSKPVPTVDTDFQSVNILQIFLLFHDKGHRNVFSR